LRIQLLFGFFPLAGKPPLRSAVQLLGPDLAAVTPLDGTMSPPRPFPDFGGVAHRAVFGAMGGLSCTPIVVYYPNGVSLH